MDIIGTIASVISGNLLKEFRQLAEAYFNKEISKEQFESQSKIAATNATKDIEIAWSEAATKMTESVQQTIRTSPVIQRAYATVLFFQLFVLFWYQFCTSAFKLATGVEWPAPMASIEWAYLLIAAMIGIGPLVYKK